LPSSLTRLLSRALVYSTFPPVSVLVRLPVRFARSYFLAAWHQPIRFTRRIHVPSLFRVMSQWIYLLEPPTSLDRHIQSTAGLASCVTPLLKHRTSSTGILNLSSITYAFRPQLRGRLTLGGRTFPRNPWDYGGRDSHPAFRYSCPHNHFHAVHVRLPLRFDPAWNAPLPRPPTSRRAPAISAASLVPIIFGAKSLD